MDRLTIAADHFLATHQQMSTEAALLHTMQRFGIYDRVALVEAIKGLSDERHLFSLAQA